MIKKLLYRISPYVSPPLVVKKQHLRGVSAALSTVEEDNKQKITDVYNLYAEPLMRYCSLRISSREKALDIVQETFIRVWQHLLRGGRITHAKSFVYTIARNLLVDEYRKKKSISLDSLLLNNTQEEFILVREEEYGASEVTHALRCVNELSPIYKTVLVMRYVDDFSVKTIASKLNKTENVVSVRIFRGLEKLRLLIAK